MQDDKIFNFDLTETKSLIIVYLTSIRAEYKYNQSITHFILKLDEKMVDDNIFFIHLLNAMPKLSSKTTANIENFYQYTYTPEYTDWEFILAKAQKTLANAKEKHFLYKQNKSLIENEKELDMLKILLLNSIEQLASNKNFQDHSDHIINFKRLLENQFSNIFLLHRLMTCALRCEISLNKKLVVSALAQVSIANTFTSFISKSSTVIMGEFCKILTGLFNTPITETLNKIHNLDKKISSLNQEDKTTHNNINIGNNDGHKNEPAEAQNNNNNEETSDKDPLIFRSTYGTF